MTRLVAILVSLCAIAFHTNAHAEEPTPTNPVLVELFTSQGCSSCPPADRVLSDLSRNFKTNVIPLAYHVDYWNYIGWTDPYSSATWSSRQRLYGRAMKTNRIYTPQLVIQGGEHLVGSRKTEVHTKIRKAAKQQSAVEIALNVTQKDGKLHLGIKTKARRALNFEKLTTFVVVFENGVTTKVTRGENSGEVLKNDHIARRISQVASPGPMALGKGLSETLQIPINKTWNRDNIGVVVFVQDIKTMTIYGAAAGKP